MDLEDKDDRDLTGPEESPPVSEAARPVPPPPTEVDPAYDPLYIDPDDPLYIPVPLGDAPDEPDGGPQTAPMEAARPEPDAETNDPPATPEPPPSLPAAETGSAEAETETVAAIEAAGVAPAEVEEPVEATATVTA